MISHNLQILKREHYFKKTSSKNIRTEILFKKNSIVRFYFFKTAHSVHTFKFRKGKTKN